MHSQHQDQDDHMQYEYKFEYSLASYCMAGSCQQARMDNAITEDVDSHEIQSTRQDEQRILRRSSELITFKCFINNETQHLIKTIFTHYINLYTPLAMRLLKISQLIFPNLNLTTSTFITRCQSHLDYQREKLVDSIKDITKIFHNQKETFMKYLALCISSAVFKILTLEDGETEVDFQSVFHTVTWELIGTHSTSQFLKKLLSETFNPINFHRYLMNEEPPKVRSFLKPGVAGGKSQMGKSVQNLNKNNAFGAEMNSSMRNIQLFKADKNLKINEKSEMSFSKRLIKEDKMNKENLPTLLNDTKSKFEKKIFQHKRQQVPNSQIAQQNQLQPFKSNKKDIDFKKNHAALIQNSSKAKTTKRPFADYLSSTKKPTFASYLQQKKLQFEP